MLNSKFQSKFFNNEFFLIYLLYFSLLISFYFGENSTGGAFTDYYGHNIQSDKPIVLLQTNGGPYDDPKQYSWTRDIPHEQAQILVNELVKNYSVFHVCRKNSAHLQGVERIDQVDNKRTFLTLLFKSEKRCLIDSCLQHAAAAFDLPSTVLWVGTSPKVFGYEMHNNILPNTEIISEAGGRMIDSVFFDHDFTGPEHEFPFKDYSIFKVVTMVNFNNAIYVYYSALNSGQHYNAIVKYTVETNGNITETGILGHAPTSDVSTFWGSNSYNIETNNAYFYQADTGDLYFLVPGDKLFKITSSFLHARVLPPGYLKGDLLFIITYYIIYIFIYKSILY